MILLRRSNVSKKAFIFEFDKDGASVFLVALNFCKIYQQSELSITKESKKEPKNESKSSLLQIIISDEEYFEYGNEKMVLAIDHESIDQGVYLLEAFIDKGYFPIAEFCGIEQKNRKNSLVQLYFYRHILPKI
jgi:hypothetical protein